ncbi:MAG TPA: hypothetical protein VHQ87_06785, partial [Rhizobacter sp.]|nr:hypothetical protein [Rhizobacter sp.]
MTDQRDHFERSLHRLQRLLDATNLADITRQLEQEIFSDPRIAGFELNLHDPSRNCLVTAGLRLPAEYAGIEDTYRGFPYALDKPDANAIAFKTRSPQVVIDNNLDRFDEITRLRFERWRMRSQLVLPFIS